MPLIELMLLALISNSAISIANAMQISILGQMTSLISNFNIWRFRHLLQGQRCNTIYAVQYFTIFNVYRIC
jgi:hypothetical protein